MIKLTYLLSKQHYYYYHYYTFRVSYLTSCKASGRRRMGAGGCRPRSGWSTAAARRPSRPDSLNIRRSGEQGTSNFTGRPPILSPVYQYFLRCKNWGILKNCFMIDTQILKIDSRVAEIIEVKVSTSHLEIDILLPLLRCRK